MEMIIIILIIIIIIIIIIIKVSYNAYRKVRTAYHRYISGTNVPF